MDEIKELEALEALENWIEGAVMACEDLSEEFSSSIVQYSRYRGKLEALSQVQTQIEIIKIAYKKSRA